MLTCVCLNPCLDRTITLGGFVYGGLNRTLDVHTDPAGKGINVAITARRLGLEAQVLGLLPREGGGLLHARLMKEGVHNAMTPVEGALRTNLKLVNQADGVTTEVNEPGAAIAQSALDAVESLIRAAAARGEMLVFSGSVPPGVGQDVYLRLMRAAGDARTVLDAGGELLHHGLAAHPFLIKPNRAELEGWAGQSLPTLECVLGAAKDIRRAGARHVCVSLGAQGALLLGEQGAFFAPGLSVPVQSTVGAGDAMLAALCQALQENLPLPEVLRRGVAAGTASTMTKGTGLIDKETFDGLLPRVEVRAL